jgi:CheY-like chemotaxis protein
VTQPDKNALIASARVLMVEDEHHARKTIRALLLAMGCNRIFEARDGESGLEAIRTFAPDVVLLDWEAPGVGGAEFVRRLRAGHPHPYGNVPIVMLTGHANHSLVLDAVRSGVHEFLLKPVSRSALKARLLSALAKHDQVQHSQARKLAS